MHTVNRRYIIYIYIIHIFCLANQESQAIPLTQLMKHACSTRHMKGKAINRDLWMMILKLATEVSLPCFCRSSKDDIGLLAFLETRKHVPNWARTQAYFSC